MSLAKLDDDGLGAPPPTRVRYAVVGVTALMAVLLYLDRFCISFAEVFIKEELHLSDIQVGWMLSAFFWTYALCQVPSGWLTDRFGARIMLTTYILLWSLFTGLTGLAFGFVMLIFLRLGFGVAQAGAYPTGASIISKWVPFTGRGSASSIVAVGGRMGGFIALYATGYLMLLFVPTSVSSLLTPEDILNAPRLSYELANGNKQTKEISGDDEQGKSGLGQRILQSASTAQREAFKTQSESYAAALAEERRVAGNEEKKDHELKPAVAAAAAAERALLADALNQVIAQPEAFDAEIVGKLQVEKEAKRLIKIPPAGRTAEETERLNRLILEALYPQSIRKVYGAGWRPMMWTYGAIGLFVAGLFWFCMRNRPREHPACNEAEVALIEYGRPKATPRSDGKVGAAPLVPLLKSGSMWLLCLAQWCTNVGWVFIVTWAPRYFQSVHNVPLETRAIMVAIPPLVGWFGMLLGGKLTDRLVGIVGLRWGRALPMSLSRFMAMSAYVVCLFNPSPWTAVVAFSVVAFSTDLGTGSIWAFKQDVGGRYVGSILGWGNMWGNLGAAVTPPLLILIVSKSATWSIAPHLPSFLSAGPGGNWNLAFATCATAFLISGLACLGVDATKPIAPDEDGGKQV